VIKVALTHTHASSYIQTYQVSGIQDASSLPNEFKLTDNGYVENG